MSSRLLETAVIDLGNQKERGCRADPAEGDRTQCFVLGRKWACRLNEGRLTIEFDFGDQLLDDFVAAEEPTDLSPQMRRHWPSVTGAVLVEMDPWVARKVVED